MQMVARRITGGVFQQGGVGGYGRACRVYTIVCYHYVKSFTASYSYCSSTKTRYKAAMRLTSKGYWKLVAYHAADSKNARTYGSADYVRVK